MFTKIEDEKYTEWYFEYFKIFKIELKTKVQLFWLRKARLARDRDFKLYYDTLKYLKEEGWI